MLTLLLVRLTLTLLLEIGDDNVLYFGMQWVMLGVFGGSTAMAHLQLLESPVDSIISS